MRRNRGGVAPGLRVRARSRVESNRAESRFSLGRLSGRDSPVGAYYVGRCRRSSVVQSEAAGKRERRRRTTDGTMVSQNIVTTLVVGERSNTNNKKRGQVERERWKGRHARCSLVLGVRFVFGWFGVQGCLTFRWAGGLGPSCRALGGRPMYLCTHLCGPRYAAAPVHHLQRQLKS